jgi:hypothetical protein
MAKFDDEPAFDNEPDLENEPELDRGAKRAARQPRTVRGTIIIGARLLTGTIGLGVAVAVIAAAALLPLPIIGNEAAGALVTPIPAAQELVCPGAVLRLGDERGQNATTATAIGAPAVVAASTDAGQTAGTVESAPLEVSDASTGGTASAPLSLRTPAGSATTDDAAPQTAALLAGVQSQSLAGGDYTGLAATSCVGATTESWLVGGSTAVGRTTLITLANPSDVASTVALTIYGERGTVTAAGATGIIVQPHGQRVLSLSGFAPAMQSPVVRVVSRGGQIVANLQQSAVRGLDAGGVDVVSSNALPAPTQVIPGVVISGGLAVAQSMGAEGFEDLATAIRVLAPGAQDASATVTLAPDAAVLVDGAPASGASFVVELVAGRVMDIPLEAIADGTYTVTVYAEVPIVAGARISTVSAVANAGATGEGASMRPQSSDFAWFAAAPLLTARTIVAIADGPRPLVHFRNEGDTDATVTLTAMDGSELSVVVPVEGAASIDVRAGETYVLDGFEVLYGAVSFLGDAQIAGYSIRPPAAESTPLTVYVK